MLDILTSIGPLWMSVISLILIFGISWLLTWFMTRDSDRLSLPYTPSKSGHYDYYMAGDAIVPVWIEDD